LNRPQTPKNIRDEACNRLFPRCRKSSETISRSRGLL